MLKRFFLSFKYAFQGIVIAIREQQSLKFQVIGGAFVIAMGFYLGLISADWIAIVGMTGLVIGLEMMNTAVEELVDMVTPERKPQAGKVKDIAAGAVLIASMAATIVLILIFKKYLFE
jgi:diacylglycerol kinase (ATP)